jgi:hypothetical protein
MKCKFGVLRENIILCQIFFNENMFNENIYTRVLYLPWAPQIYLTTFYSSIGVGPDYPKFKDELANMASSKNHTFHVDDLDKLEEIRKELVQYICGAQGR